MPVYVFRCDRCQREQSVSLPVEERNTAIIWCENPDCPTDRLRTPQQMIRIPTVAGFSIKGYSMKNAYSDDGFSAHEKKPNF